ncbi:MAG: hypothetical protein FH749_01080 [Firmicutes bacterium]|nr:hypothetical protein [Bacillota bacterium]
MEVHSELVNLGPQAVNDYDLYVIAELKLRYGRNSGNITILPRALLVCAGADVLVFVIDSITNRQTQEGEKAV